MAPVPQWNQLSQNAQNDLANWKNWYISNRTNGERRLTLLNVYSKLKSNNLWQFVKGPSSGSTSKGNLRFEVTNVNDFKQKLRNSDDFGNPETSSKKWSSREHRILGSLHFKHNSDWGHATNEVQAHIDTFGLIAPLLHWETQEGYKNVHGIRNLLCEQGHDRSTLFGVPSTAPRLIRVGPFQIKGRKPLPRLRKIWPPVKEGIIPGPDIGDILNSRRMGQIRNYVPPLKTHKPRVPPPYKHHAYRWKIPTGQINPFPPQVSNVLGKHRQDWLRTYYQTNPAAAMRARNEARTIINWAHKHLTSPPSSIRTPTQLGYNPLRQIGRPLVSPNRARPMMKPMFR